MQNISILNRTTKAAGEIRLRFRLRDGRAVDLTHRSEIRANLQEVAKFDADGTPRKGVRIYSRQLAAEIAAEMKLMSAAYKNIIIDDAPRNNVVFARYIEREKNGKNAGAGDIETRFAEYIADGVRDGVRGKSATHGCKYAGRILHRFLAVENLQGIKPGAFDAEKVLRLRSFAINEYQYTDKYAKVYAGEKRQQIPTQKRGRNTVAILMHIYAAFFTELEDAGEIDRTPFARIGKEKRKKINREQYNTPVYLTAEELQIIQAAQVPDELEETRTAFLVQCAIGCRISDYKRLTIRNVSRHEEGFLYVHYLPQKTHESASDFAEIETPLVQYAAKVIASRGGFSFAVLRDSYEYNKKIRKLLECCGINRECAVYDEETGQNQYKPLYEIASSKTARKTHVDMFTKVQVNLYASGLHKPGSGAVLHYTELTTAARFQLLCAAFSQEPYKTDKDFNII